MLDRFHPLVRDWFRETLGEPSAPQVAGWPAIASGDHALILAPTGTGKTLAAFLWELNALVVQGQAAPLPNAVQILYISPLKALNNDIQRNLESPLAQLKERFEAAGQLFPDIRIAVRTGDTPASARARMLRKSPHILITTPESLHIMLTSVRGRGMFSGVRAVIVDEIHALAATKRGVHLALTLERLERLCEQPPQRIGLSATQRPLAEVAAFLGGCDPVREEEPVLRPVAIVDCGLVKPLEISVESPVEDLGHVDGTIWPAVAPLVLEHVRRARTTIVFVNNRAQAERMAARINALATSEVALPYHGSLSRERRLMLEGQLKAGQIRALVSTSSLELGIDIGSVDLVVQLQSPKRVSTGLQRVGRAGHALETVSRGVFVPTFRDDAMEMLAIVRGMRDGEVEPTRVIQNALDVLAQVMVAAVSIDDDWTSAALFDMVRRAYPYHRLSRAAFDEVLAMLAGKYPAHLSAELDARLTWDRASDMLTSARASRMVSVISGGTIPDRGYYTVNLPDRTRLGELDEEFVHETRVGDVFQLGSSTWRVGAIEHDRVVVTPAPGAPARMPFWHGEYAARSLHLTARVGELRRMLDAARTDEEVSTIATRYECDGATARSLVNYVHEQRAFTSIVPDDRTLVAEQFRDETGAVRIVLHAPFGGRVNAPWGMVLAQRLRERLSGKGGAGLAVEVQTTDDGIMLRLPQLLGSAPMDALRDVTPQEAERRVLEEIGDSALFGARFRMNAARALLLPRGNTRRRMPLWLQRLKAQDLLQVVREFPSFPILVETYRDILQDAFDMPGLVEVLQRLQSGQMEIRTVDTNGPSPFASSLQFGFVMDWMYADDTPRAERRAGLLSLDRALLDELLGAQGPDEETLAALDDLLAARRGTAPGRRARDAAELLLLLERAGDLTTSELKERVATAEEGLRGEPMRELMDGGRALTIQIPDGSGAMHERVISAESHSRYLAASGDDTSEREGARREILSRFVALNGLVSVDDVRARYAFDAAWVEQWFEELTRSGRLVRVTRTATPTAASSRGTASDGGAASVPRWASRRLLEQARRRELARARKAVEAVELPVFVGFLQRWQHLGNGSHEAAAGVADRSVREQGSASERAAEALRQLYGIARPAESWERQYLRPRIDGYGGDSLANLALSGEFAWVGAGPRDESAPGELSTIVFVKRGTGRAWLREPTDEALLSAGARAVRDSLARDGASFFEDLATNTGLGGRALRDSLRELVGAGLVTSDSMHSLEAVVRWRPVVPPRVRNQPDPTRWLPADYVPSQQRPIVQRRTSVRRLPKWKPSMVDAPDAKPWPGRWSLVRTPRIMGTEQDESSLAVIVAQQWLERYGVVSREWWRRERPRVSWRAIYTELKRMEYRGEVRRGYFVSGLAGAQFALPNAVEALRASAESAPGAIAMAATDPANAYSLPTPPGVARDPVAHRRGRGTILVTRAGAVVLASDRRGRRIHVRVGASLADVTAAARALTDFIRTLAAASRTTDIIVETIDGTAASRSPHAAAFREAGYRVTTRGLRYYG